MIFIDQERPQDSAEIEKLLDAAFGPARAQKSSYKLRTKAPQLPQLSTVMRAGDKVAATVRFSKIHVRGSICGKAVDALLLGPLAVDLEFQMHGLGSQLVRHTLNKATSFGFGTILLVGEIGYYERFGFERVAPRLISMPGGRDADRLLVYREQGQPALPFVGTVQPDWSWEAERLAPAFV